MPEIVVDATADAIVANIASTLQSVTIDGQPAFNDDVKIIDDIDSFVRLDDSLKRTVGVNAGIVVGTIEQQAGTIDVEDSVRRMPIDIYVRFMRKRKPGEDERSALADVRRLIQIVRDAIGNDRSRGGHTNLVMWGGRIIDGTDVTGTARTISKVPNQLFYVVSIPVACAWSVLIS
jgi:hypothetical protein